MRLLALLTVALAFPASAFADCGPAADLDANDPGLSLWSARKATLCLLNAERRIRHEQPLRFNRRLILAGARHAQDMVHRKYFAHTALSGETFVDRLVHVNYIHPYPHWTVGENLGWGRPGYASPRQLVSAWMHSPTHRRNILTRSFREIGIAIVRGSPRRDVRFAATYDTEFGVIHSR